ncbi:MAG: hypothetical protein LKCHEGNO_01006 [Burkholderiaceae bacterium]|nr:hypothetical protein [Burkholderiaceae bacterium]
MLNLLCRKVFLSQAVPGRCSQARAFCGGYCGGFGVHASELARQERLQIERGIDVAAAKQADKALALDAPTVDRLADIWLARYIEPRYKHPEVVARVLRRHVRPVRGKLAPPDVQPAHIDHVLTRIVADGAPTVANDALRHLSFMFRMAVRNQWSSGTPPRTSSFSTLAARSARANDG